MNYKNKWRVIRPIKLIIGLIIIVITIVFQGCEKEESQFNPIKYSNSYYETMLKGHIEGLTKNSSRLKHSFIITNGLPLWDKAKWVDTKSGKMFVVPLLNSSKSTKHLIGIIKDNNIVPVITEYSDLGNNSKKVYSINNRILYDSNNGIMPIVRLKSGSAEGDETTVTDLMDGDCGTAEDLFYASNTGCGYNSSEIFASIRICTGAVNGDNSSWSLAGHAWIEIHTYSGEEVTFSLWGNQGSQEYWVNREINYNSTSSMSTSLSYNQFQNILDYNNYSSNTNWQYTNTCASYSVGVWNTATGSSINFGSITTPYDIYNYITNH